MRLPMPVICECGFATLDAQKAIDHITEKHPESLPNCKDIGKGLPCGNYPAKTADECTFCKGWAH